MVYVCVCMCVCVYVCMCVCLYVCVYLCGWSLEVHSLKADAPSKFIPVRQCVIQVLYMYMYDKESEMIDSNTTCCLHLQMYIPNCNCVQIVYRCSI